MTVNVRFAPSPTGRLHIGNIRTAILNWLLARKEGGNVLLRFDDTDRERSTEEFVEAIREDMSWLGLTWDREARQSDRTARYDEIAEKWKAEGRLYACYESGDELERKRKRQLGRGLPPIYDRAGLKLNRDARAKLEAEGRTPHWRFRLPNTASDDSLDPVTTTVSWDDIVRGPQTVDLGSLSDPVLIRADGSYLYTLTSVVDDSDLDITHVLRGADHITNTGVQVALFEALGLKPPVFGHHNLLVMADGGALSKRLGSLSIGSLRESGLEALAVDCHAALIGTSDPIEPHLSLDNLADLFEPSKISASPAKFDANELANLNAKLLHMTPYDAVASRLEALGVTGGEVFWLAVCGNLERFSDVATWWDIVSKPTNPIIEDASFTNKAAELLPQEPWDDAMWSTWTKAIKSETGAKGRALFHPLRLALTGRENGPELKPLMALIGRDRVLSRLQGNKA
ncbi:MAG: glutamate--tRNA ligase [Hyphomicrobiaceae bacterium]